MCQELKDELQKLVDIYARMHEVSSGDEIKDEGFLEAFDIVLSDLRDLIEDVQDNPFHRPDIPVGFKLHAVRH